VRTAKKDVDTRVLAEFGLGPDTVTVTFERMLTCPVTVWLEVDNISEEVVQFVQQGPPSEQKDEPGYRNAIFTLSSGATTGFLNLRVLSAEPWRMVAPSVLTWSNPKSRLLTLSLMNGKITQQPPAAMELSPRTRGQLKIAVSSSGSGLRSEVLLLAASPWEQQAQRAQIKRFRLTAGTGLNAESCFEVNVFDAKQTIESRGSRTVYVHRAFWAESTACLTGPSTGPSEMADTKFIYVLFSPITQKAAVFGTRLRITCEEIVKLTKYLCLDCLDLSQKSPYLARYGRVFGYVGAVNPAIVKRDVCGNSKSLYLALGRASTSLFAKHVAIKAEFEM
jgi:hypothetical protein